MIILRMDIYISVAHHEPTAQTALYSLLGAQLIISI
ncbi:hypothetical protein BIZ78_gp073 [Erwinia phage vB_EamM_Caitlin]|nr:hypothetical protein BIZ78_gp073 [Erwinia phage vB_EamM_Caitlin]ANZ48502.1 hypothetical protein CAITLIN_207 [Erwinia phage vB_EamM_Caitlin]